VVNADRAFRADVLCVDGQMLAVGEGLQAPAGATVIDAGGQYVMPGGIDPHTHMQLPFMGTVTPTTSTPAPPPPGRRHHEHHRLRHPEPAAAADGRLPQWRGWAEKAAADYAFHVAVTWWSDRCTPTWARWCARRA
jgi:dihydropyrimidinase